MERHIENRLAEEELRHLSMLCSMQMTVKNHASCLKISRPRETSRHLLKALEVSMPLAPPHREIRVVTRKNSLKTEISLEVQYLVDTRNTWLRDEDPMHDGGLAC